jgi:hypothetical protein
MDFTAETQSSQSFFFSFGSLRPIAVNDFFLRALRVLCGEYSLAVKPEPPFTSALVAAA